MRRPLRPAGRRLALSKVCPFEASEKCPRPFEASERSLGGFVRGGVILCSSAWYSSCTLLLLGVRFVAVQSANPSAADLEATRQTYPSPPRASLVNKYPVSEIGVTGGSEISKCKNSGQHPKKKFLILTAGGQKTCAKAFLGPSAKGPGGLSEFFELFFLLSYARNRSARAHIRDSAYLELWGFPLTAFLAEFDRLPCRV